MKFDSIDKATNSSADKKVTNDSSSVATLYADNIMMNDNTGSVVSDTDTNYLHDKSDSVYSEEWDISKTYKNDNLNILSQNLDNCLGIINDEVMKEYVTKLDSLEVLKLDEEMIKNLKDIQFFKITELVYQENEFDVHKLATVFHSLSNKPCTLVLMITSDGNRNDFFMGVRSLMDENSSGTMRDMLQQSLLGLFQGSKVEQYYLENMNDTLKRMKTDSVSSVTCVADYKTENEGINNKEFIQGLEKFVYSMQGMAYTSIFVADNVSYDALSWIRNEYEKIYTQISPFANMQLNFNSSSGKSISDSSSEGQTKTNTRGTSLSKGGSETNTRSYTEGRSRSEGFTDTKGSSSSESKGESDTKTKSHTDGTSESKGYNIGINIGGNHSISNGIFSGHTIGGGASLFGLLSGNYGYTMGTSLTNSIGSTVGVNGGISRSTSISSSDTNSVSKAISNTLTHGITSSHSDSQTIGNNESNTKGMSYSNSMQYGESESISDSLNFVTSKSLTDTFGDSQGITLNAKNMTLTSILDKIEKHVKRIDECESIGMWNFAAYFLGESKAETETAANIYQSVISGRESGIERSAVNTWTDKSKLKDILLYIKNFMHPYFIYNSFSYEEKRIVLVNPSALINTNELAIHMGLPRHSVNGLPVTEHAAFAQEVLTRNKNNDGKFNIGNIYHLGEEKDTPVNLDSKSLTMHTFITGSTGAGKSNTVYHILNEAEKNGIPFLVVEPAKGEYRNVLSNARCFGTNPYISELLRINPFSFPDGIHILEHIDRLVEIFNVCWPMYAAMPAVLKESIENAYISVGWDLDLSVNKKIDGLFPTFDDVLEELNTSINNSAYSADTKSDYIGSLSTRLKSLTNGINGRIFVNNEIPLEDLFDKSAILDISRIGSMETKSLIMGLVVLKLQEYRMSCSKEMNSELKHITVLEEAHNLLRKTSTEQNQESSNIAGKSVEMITNSIAEMRTYGEGFIIVDQAPNLLDTAAIRNTNTKIVMRLPEGSDRNITGLSMALKENQITELSKLPTGVAAVYQNNWQETVLCKIPEYKSSINTNKEKLPICTSRQEENNNILRLILKNEYNDNEKEEIEKKILKLNVSAKIRSDLIMNLGTENKVFEWAVADFIKKNYKFEHIFHGTDSDENWETLQELYEIIRYNIKDEFSEFNDEELVQIIYYICFIEHEKYPDNDIIEMLKHEYLKRRMVR